MHPNNGALAKKDSRGRVRRLPDGRIKPSPSLSPRIWRVATYLDQCFAQPVTLRQAATIVDLHPDYLSRRFKREIGVGFHEYLVTLRLQRATTLLVTSTRSIKEIGYEVGFRAPEVFSKAFKRFMGCSPKTYRIHNLAFYGSLASWASDAGLTDKPTWSMHDDGGCDLFDLVSDCWDEP